MRIGIIGFGRIAPFHAAAIRSLDADLVVATRSDENRARAGEAGASQVFSDWRAMLDAGVDGVVCALPVLNIAAALGELIDTGVPVLVEKPVGLHPDTTRELADAAEAKGAPVMVAMNRRFYTNLARVRELAASEKLLGITINAPDRMHRIASADIHPTQVLEHWLYANIIHSLDLIRYWGGEVDSVQAWRVPGSTTYTWNHAATVLLKSGALGQYTGHFDAPGSWILDAYFDGSRVSLTGHEQGQRVFRDGSTETWNVDGPDLTHKPGFYGQMAHFVAGIERRAYPGYDLRDATATMELIRQIHEASVWSGEA